MDFQNLTPEQMYQASLQKDGSFEGVFYMAVKTTGIFCRPACTARKPKFENVSFYATPEEAMEHGYRACKVCKPLQLVDEPDEGIKVLLQLVQAEPGNRVKDYDLKEMGLTPATVRRWFNQYYGMTFQAYQRSLRIKKALGELKRGEKVSYVAYGNGFESLSGFHDSFKKTTGHSPNKAKKNDRI